MGNGSIRIDSDSVYFIDLTLNFANKFGRFSKSLHYSKLFFLILGVLGLSEVLVGQGLDIGVSLLHELACLKLILHILKFLECLFLGSLNRLILIFLFFNFD
jgi:hypothetical protein